MEVLIKYLNLGFTHVIPFGYDHALFILCISLDCKSWRSLLLRCSLFTLAHSITLGLSAAGIMPGAAWVEPLITFTILYAALENIIFSKGQRLRLLMIFIFGLVHGVGFAGALRDAGLPEDNFFAALLSFNIGVELGQIAIVSVIWFPLIRLIVNKEWYDKRVVYPVSSVIACLAFFWTLKRLSQP